MAPIRKKILTDDKQRPLAVQIDYADWLMLEKWLETQSHNGSRNGSANGSPQAPPPATDLNRFAGTLTLREDPLAYQQRSRDEWA